MKFYHGTRNKDLKKLNLEHYSGKIYITDSYQVLQDFGITIKSKIKLFLERFVMTILRNNFKAKNVTFFLAM